MSNHMSRCADVHNRTVLFRHKPCPHKWQGSGASWQLATAAAMDRPHALQSLLSVVWTYHGHTTVDEAVHTKVRTGDYDFSFAHFHDHP